MNHFDLIIGLGLGVLIAIIAREFIDARKEKIQALEEKENLHRRWHDCANSKLTKLVGQMELVVDRIDQHAGRIEGLEKITKPLNEISVKALHDNYANILIAISKGKK